MGTKESHVSLAIHGFGGGESKNSVEQCYYHRYINTNKMQMINYTVTVQIIY
jgi:hypothetical protein